MVLWNKLDSQLYKIFVDNIFLVSLFYFFVLKRKFFFKIIHYRFYLLALFQFFHYLFPQFITIVLIFFIIVCNFLLSLFNTDMISNKILNFTFIIIFLISTAFQGYMLVNQKNLWLFYFIRTNNTWKRNSGE